MLEKSHFLLIGGLEYLEGSQTFAHLLILMLLVLQLLHEFLLQLPLLLLQPIQLKFAV